MTPTNQSESSDSGGRPGGTEERGEPCLARPISSELADDPANSLTVVSVHGMRAPAGSASRMTRVSAARRTVADAWLADAGSARLFAEVEGELLASFFPSLTSAECGDIVQQSLAEFSTASVRGFLPILIRRSAHAHALRRLRVGKG